MWVIFSVPCNRRSRPAESALVFESLLPVDPQPAHDFVCLLAFPEWAAAGPLILVDARQVDGRLFCCEMQGALSRSSFLLQIGVEDRPGLCITVAGYEWPLGTDVRDRVPCVPFSNWGLSTPGTLT